MAKARSPQYPAIGLKEAVDKITAVYTKDYQNKITREVIAKHMGYDSLHGKALGVLSALGKYGLLEGRADENRVSDLAVTIIAHQPGSTERSAALREAAGKPELFAEIDSRFNGGKGSDPAIRSYLLTQKFIPGAADLAIRSYRETKQLVEAESGGYNGSEIEPEKQPVTPQVHTPSKPQVPHVVKLGQQHAAFPLPEGEVSLSFPADLSVSSAQTMAAFVKLALEQAERQAKARETTNQAVDLDHLKNDPKE